MPKLSVAATQMACSWDLPANLERAEELIREASARGAQVILILYRAGCQTFRAGNHARR